MAAIAVVTVLLLPSELQLAYAQARRAAMRADSLENDAKEATRRSKDARTEARRLTKQAQTARKGLEQAESEFTTSQ